MGLGWLRPGDEPEPVPSDALKGIGPAPGYRTQVVADPVERDKLLRQYGVAANDSFNAHRIEAGVIPQLGLVVMPPDASPALQDHENLHTYGVQHFPDGRGWELVGSPPQDIDPRLQTALMSLPRSQTSAPLTHDWGQTFAKLTPPAPQPIQQSDPGMSGLYQLGKTASGS